MLPLVLLLCRNCVLAGQDSTRKTVTIVNVNPTTLIDVFNSLSFRTGVEILPAGRFSFGMDGGAYLYWPKETKGYAIVPQLKYYFKKSETNPWLQRNYVSLQYAYKDRRYSYKDSIEAANGLRWMGKFGMRQFINSVTVNYGGISYSNKRWVYDYYIGAGVRVVYSTSYLDPKYHVYDYHDWTTDLFTYPQFSAGKLIYPTICLGLKIGYRVSKSRL